MKTIASLLFLLFAIHSYSQDLHIPKTETQGVYLKYARFLSEKPSVPDGFRIDSTILLKNNVWKGTYSFTPYNKLGPMTEIWGFCDGKHNYINFRNKFFKIFKENEYYVVYAYALADKSGSSLAFLSSGLIGVALERIGSTEYSKKILHKYYIDPYTGELVPFKETLDFFENEKRYGELVLYRQDNSDNKEPINFSINDSLLYSFPPHSYVKLILPLTKEPYIISFDSKINNEKYVYLDIHKTLYLKCSRLNFENEIINFQDVTEEIGIWESNESNLYQKKRKRKQTK